MVIYFLHDRFTNLVFILCLNPALPCSNLGFVCETTFAFETIGFMVCFSGCVCGSKL